MLASPFILILNNDDSKLINILWYSYYIVGRSLFYFYYLLLLLYKVKREMYAVRAMQELDHLILRLETIELLEEEWRILDKLRLL